MIAVNSLIARLKEAKGGDRNLDADLFRFISKRPNGVVDWSEVPNYTSSIDAAQQFVEAILPLRSATVIREALKMLSSKFHWHINVAKSGQIEYLPIAMVLVSLQLFIDKDG